MVAVPIAIEHLSKSYRVSNVGRAVLRRRCHSQRIRIDALSDVSMSLEEGRWLGILGRNGAGKTTLLKVLAGLLRPDTGTVSVQGSIACFFGFGVGFHPDRTLRENLRLHGLLYGIAKGDLQDYIGNCLALAQLQDRADHQFCTLSTGMRQRLAFAAAAHVPADIYLFDEVLAVGDRDFKEKCIGFFEDLKKRNVTVVMASQDRGKLERWCDEIVELESGRVV